MQEVPELETRPATTIILTQSWEGLRTSRWEVGSNVESSPHVSPTRDWARRERVTLQEKTCSLHRPQSRLIPCRQHGVSITGPANGTDPKRNKHHLSGVLPYTSAWPGNMRNHEETADIPKLRDTLQTAGLHYSKCPWDRDKRSCRM